MLAHRTDKLLYVFVRIFVEGADHFTVDGQLDLTSKLNPDQQEIHWMVSGLDLQDGWNELKLDMYTPDAFDSDFNAAAINFFRLYMFTEGPLSLELDYVGFGGENDEFGTDLPAYLVTPKDLEAAAEPEQAAEEPAPEGGAEVLTSPKLSLEKTEFEQGEEILVNAWSEGAQAGNRDWVGLYREGDVPGDTPSLAWYYVADEGKLGEWVDIASGLALDPGTYKVMLLADDGYDILLTLDLTVEAAEAPAPEIEEPIIVPAADLPAEPEFAANTFDLSFFFALAAVITLLGVTFSRKKT